MNGSGEASREVLAENLAAVREAGIVLALRESDAQVARLAARAALEGGLSAIEVTLTTRSALDIIAELATDPRALPGAGTVLEAHQVDEVARAGARFILSPVFAPEVVRRALELGLFVAPGAATPTEIWRAARSGAPAVKVFPIGQLGGPAYLVAVRGPFPSLALLPTNGVKIEALGDYFEAGALAVGVGREVFDRAATGRGDFAEVTRRAARFAVALRTARDRSVSGGSY